MNLEVIFPIITITVSLMFVLSVSEQYKRKKKPHQLVWAIAMFLFFVTAGAEALALILGKWPPIMYRLYYVFAAIQVSLMGGGVVYLFASRSIINEKNTDKAMIIHGIPWLVFSLLFLSQGYSIFLFIFLPSGLVLLLALLSVLRISKVREWWQTNVSGMRFAHFFLGFSVYIFLLMNIYAWTEPLNLDRLATGGQISGLGWELSNSPDGRALVRLFSPLETIPGAIALIGGGFYSYIAWQMAIFRNEGKFKPKTGFFNVNIAFGAYILGQGAFFSGLGFSTLYISEVLSVSLMYLGFIQSDKTLKVKLFDTIKMKYMWRGTSDLSTDQKTL